MSPDEIAHQLRAARDDFHILLDGAMSAELRGATKGTRWTNEQFMFHMLFGYLVVRNLLPVVRAFGRLPRSRSRRFAAILDAATRPFHVINYVGSLGGARLLVLAKLLEPGRWAIRTDTAVTAWAFPAEVLVAARRA